jgi:hypothetical protein
MPFSERQSGQFPQRNVPVPKDVGEISLILLA